MRQQKILVILKMRFFILTYYHPQYNGVKSFSSFSQSSLHQVTTDPVRLSLAKSYAVFSGKFIEDLVEGAGHHQDLFSLN